MANSREASPKGVKITFTDPEETTRRLRTKSSSDHDIYIQKSSPEKYNSKSLQDLNDATEYCNGRMIKLEEVAPQFSAIILNEENTWMQRLSSFSSKRQATDKGLPRSVRRYYKQQNELIKAFEETHADIQENEEGKSAIDRIRRQSSILAKVSFVCNLVLLLGKAVAAGLSGSLAVITSVVDSAVDLVSGILMWCSGRAVKQKDPYRYPQGRTKLEPVSIVVLSVVMALASFQVILQSLLKIVAFAVYDLRPPSGINITDVVCISMENVTAFATQPAPTVPVFDVESIVICAVTIVTKLILFIVCRRVQSPSAQALAQDHRNDVISNTAAVACGLMGSMLWKYADPIGATLIGVYIIVSWCIMGWQQIKMLTGHTARPEFLKRITWIALNHHEKITHIDTVRAFHFGNNFLVEIDIVLPEDMTLLEAHDIGETLQVKLERMDEVERAFVHVDYEAFHDTKKEHKVV